MTSTNFTIGTINEGLRKDTKPYASPDDSFEVLVNAYPWRGRLVKRSGYSSLGRLTNGTPVMGLRTQERFDIGVQSLIAFDTTNDYLFNGTTFVPLPSIMPVTWSGTDYNFFYSINYANSFWATNNKPGLNGYVVTDFTNQAGAGPWQVDVTAAGNNFQVNDQVYFVNVTGAGAANNLRSGIVTVAGATFTISSATGGIFTNGVATSGLALSSTRAKPGEDGIRYYGVLSNGTGWANYNPPIDPNTALAGALLIFAYRGYLVFLNTWEGNDLLGVKNFGNRARWTWVGTPYYSLPTPQSPNIFGYDPEAVRDDLFGRGGANDAPTNEVIVGANFIRDILVVFFERSTWRLRFVNNSQNPFVWERVNIELGSDCTFSTIPFDKGLMAIGNRGIVISDSNDTVRFDEKIPDTIFDISQTENGLERVFGIRTFRTKINYWAFRSNQATSKKYPDSVLVFNYEGKNWSLFDDSFTCFGYYYKSSPGLTWNDLPDAWSTYDYISWDSGVSQTGYENIIAGNQQGYVFVLETTSGKNSPSLSISAINLVGSILTSVNNNLAPNSWIKLTGVTGTTSSDGVSLEGRNFQFNNPGLNPDEFTLSEFKPITPLNQALGATYTYTISYKNILKGSPQINVGALVFKDVNVDGVLVEASSLGSGTINYKTGQIDLIFNPPIGVLTDVHIRVVTLDPLQDIEPVTLIGAYTGGGEIAKISGLDVQSKVFNFFKDNKRARLSKIDFYTNLAPNGQFTCNVFSDSSNIAVNKPLKENPLSNVVVMAKGPYQFGIGDQVIYRLFCDAIAQTIQLQFTYSNAQLAVDCINQSDVEILALMVTMRQGGRMV